MTLQDLVTFVPHLAGLGPQALSLLGALVVSATALQGLLLALGKMLPASSRAAHVVGVVALDLGKALEIAGRLAKFAKTTAVGGALLLVACATAGCTPAERAALHVPEVTPEQAIDLSIQFAANWAKLHGAPATDVNLVASALQSGDPYRAVSLLRVVFDGLAAAGVSVPPDMVAIVNTAEGAMAARGVAKGMSALSKP